MRKDSGVVEKRIRAPHEGNAERLAVDFHEREVAQLGGELGIGGNFREVERFGEAGARDGSGDVAGGRDDVVVGSTATAELGYQVVARTHIGSGNLAVVSFFKRGEGGRIGGAFPDQQVQRIFLFLAGAEQ